MPLRLHQVRAEVTRPYPMWTGRGMVTNCERCAGIEVCPLGPHKWDAGEWGNNPPEYCPAHSAEMYC